MENVKLRVIPEPAPNSRTVFKSSAGEKALIVGQGKGIRNYICGNCDLPLIENMGDGVQFRNL